MREETTNLFWSPVGINNWQPLGEVISTPHFSNEQIEQDRWADKGMFTATATATVKTTNKIRRLFHVKKRRLPRKMKKALRGVATLTPCGKWRLSSYSLSNVKIKTKWQRKAFRKYAYRIMKLRMMRY